MPTSLRGRSYSSYFSAKHSYANSISFPKLSIISEQTAKYHHLSVYLCLLLKIILITVVIKMVSRGIFDMIFGWNLEFYETHDIWIASILIAVLLPQSVLAYYLIITIYSQRRHRRKIILIHSLTSIACIAFILYYAVQWHLYHSLPPIVYPARDIYIGYSNVYEASMYIYYLPVNLALSLMLLFLVSHCQEKRAKHQQQHQNYIELDLAEHSISQHNYKVLNMPLTGNTDIDLGYHALTDDDPDEHRPTRFEESTNSSDLNKNMLSSFHKHIFLWTSFLVFLTIMYYVQYCFHNFNTAYMQTHYENVIRAWIAWCIAVKFVLKYIGHEFDVLRIKLRDEAIHATVQSIGDLHQTSIAVSAISVQDEEKCDVSFEVILEVWLSLSYWMILRYYLVVHPQPIIWYFLAAKGVHIASELYTCCKMSRFYFEYSSRFITWLKQREWYKRANEVCCIPVFYIGNDECEYSEWFNRCSIDIGVRFIVAITTSIYMYLALSLLYWFHATFGYAKQTYILASWFTLASTVIEVLFYFGLYGFYKIKYGINVFEACAVLYYQCGRRRIYAMTFFAILTFYGFV